MLFIQRRDLFVGALFNHPCSRHDILIDPIEKPLHSWTVHERRYSLVDLVCQQFLFFISWLREIILFRTITVLEILMPFFAQLWFYVRILSRPLHISSNYYKATSSMEFCFWR